MSRLQSAENFAKERHLGKTINEISHYIHLGAVVARLKNLGITDQDTISAAWLHDIIEYTTTSFDEIDQRFGSKVAVLVLSISKDKSLPKVKQEEQYVKQLRNSSVEAKIIKLCDISANLKDLKVSSFSKSRKVKEMKKSLFYLNVIKSDLVKNMAQVPGITSLVNGINDTIVPYGLRPVILQ
ncbi:MAG: bifunctional (p)ppGpp synthetase/guanosine-3',5'-bis(diphosphate) 3'-pyrophosphohydrolase [Thaumarchaeota archaeon]|nr:bifunctional (p)ppGpp synthetase/guanosine-3',5'-bis(diphosphate) 3'-pyrophosphohydrolase [Nitrososphaerota archaeon]